MIGIIFEKGGDDMKRILALVLTMMFCFSLTSCGMLQDEQAFLEKELSSMNFSGVVRLTKNGRVLCEYVAGTEQPDSKRKITRDTKFCVGSVSKQFAAASIMLLKQDGKLNVEDTMDKYFPDYRYGKQLTLKHLLTMRSGIPEFYDVIFIDDAFTEVPVAGLDKTITNDGTPEQNQKLLEEWLLKQPLDTPPDTVSYYSNSNYFLLSRVVELVSGMKYNDFVRERIFKPLQMTHSGFVDDEDWQHMPNLAKPSVDTQTVYVGVTRGLGDMISDAKDMERWMRSLRTYDILTEASVKEMTTNYSPEDEMEYGYGLMPDKDGSFCHTGSFTTYHALAYSYPKLGIDLFGITNDSANLEGDLNEVCFGLLSRVIQKESAK